MRREPLRGRPVSCKAFSCAETCGAFCNSTPIAELPMAAQKRCSSFVLSRPLGPKPVLLPRGASPAIRKHDTPSSKMASWCTISNRVVHVMGRGEYHHWLCRGGLWEESVLLAQWRVRLVVQRRVALTPLTCSLSLLNTRKIAFLMV